VWYRVRVQAVNAVGVGAFSIPIRVTTRALPPYPPVLELTSVGATSVRLKWGDGKNVDLLRYVLEMRRDDYGRFVSDVVQFYPHPLLRRMIFFYTGLAPSLAPQILIVYEV